MQHVGVAISGGGHRATMWGLGPLLYLVDADKHREVAVLSSVSGGSILNGVVAHETDYPRTDPDTFDRSLAPLVRHVADTGLFFWGPATNRYVVSLLVTSALAVLTLVAGVVLLAVTGLGTWAAVVLVAAAILLAISLWLFSRRSLVVDRALAKVHFHTDGMPTKLEAVRRSVDHVFCATELQGGGHLYLAPDFVYSYQFGAGVPAGLDLATAVQASACLPGVFAARRLKAAPHGFEGGTGDRRDDDMVLTDGGVYDNMAEQWIVGLDERPTGPRDGTGAAIDVVVVVNASAGGQWRRLARARLPLLAEFATLKRVNDVMYQATTRQRRHGLVRSWDLAERDRVGVRGALVHIAQSPYTVADSYQQEGDRWPERAERAAAVIALLGDSEAGRATWAARAEASRGVKTVLRSLGRETTLDLLEHSYVLAMSNLHVLLGYPLLAVPGRDRFARLLETAGAPATVKAG